jgi:hypothetical protein
MVLRNEQLEEVASLMEELARALRLLMVDAAPAPPIPPVPPAQPVPPPPVPPQRGNFEVGSRVELTRRLDRHRGRRGVVISKWGDLFWDLQLDVQGRETAGPSIYRKETSLRVLP